MDKIIPFNKNKSYSRSEDLQKILDEGITIPNFSYKSFLEYVHNTPPKKFEEEMTNTPQINAIILVHNLMLYDYNMALILNDIFFTQNVFNMPLYYIMANYIDMHRGSHKK